MANYAVVGKLGTGKTKFAVWRAQLALKEGRRVASNVDLFLDKLRPADPLARYVRLPDKPSAADLEGAGHGNPDSYDEDRNGVMILDELGTWLNSRSFQDKGRAGLLDWLIHARKLGWDVFLIVQDAAMIDKQVRTALIEYEAKCLRLDKVKLPLIGGVLNDVFGRRVGYLPRMHLVAARVGEGANAVVAERWTYRGDWLHAAYDTRQVFRSDYPHGVHSVINPERWNGQPLPSRWQRFRISLGLTPGAHAAVRLPHARPEPRPRLPIIQAIERCLPPHERPRHIRRLDRLGLLSGNLPFKAGC